MKVTNIRLWGLLLETNFALEFRETRVTVEKIQASFDADDGQVAGAFGVGLL